MGELQYNIDGIPLQRGVILPHALPTEMALLDPVSCRCMLQLECMNSCGTVDCLHTNMGVCDIVSKDVAEPQADMSQPAAPVYALCKFVTIWPSKSTWNASTTFQPTCHSQ